jgi:hypothetical protein
MGKITSTLHITHNFLLALGIRSVMSCDAHDMTEPLANHHSECVSTNVLRNIRSIWVNSLVLCHITRSFLLSLGTRSVMSCMCNNPPEHRFGPLFRGFLGKTL